jgi:hypothetical protein
LSLSSLSRALEEPMGSSEWETLFPAPVFEESSNKSSPSVSDYTQPSLMSVTTARGSILFNVMEWEEIKIEAGKRSCIAEILHHFKGTPQTWFGGRIVCCAFPRRNGTSLLS